jgi:hypothetical protein
MRIRPIQAIIAAACLALAPAVAAGPARADTVICEKYGSTTIQGGRYIVQNNNWGDNTQQCINVTGTGFSVTQASHNKPLNGAPGAYPSVYAGCHYGNCSSGSGLPLQASNSRFGTVQTSVSMSYPGAGTYNASYDLWFDPTPRTNGQNTGAEVMIWLNRVGSIQPVGSRVGTVTLAGGTWEVWYGNSGWNVISYVRTSATTSLSFPVSTFYNDAVSRGYAQRSWYLTSVQAGFEPWIGQVGLAVNNFSYSIGGGGGGGGGGGAERCRVAYTANSWNNGLTGGITITNVDIPSINGWTLTWTFPSGQRITQMWNANYTQSSSTVTASGSAAIPPGGSVNFGFNGTHSGTDTRPSSFALNGTTCANV